MILACGGAANRSQDNGRTDAPPKEATKDPLVSKPPGRELDKKEDVPSIPSDVSYSVISSRIIPRVINNRSLEIRISRRVPQDVLRAIALKIKSEDSRTYERTMIAYYLPGMTVGSGAWATTHFNPSLEVRILGLSAEAEESLRNQKVTGRREVMGTWLCEAPMPRRIMLYRLNNKVFLEETYNDGSGHTNEVIERKVSGGIRLDKKEKRPVEMEADEHWLLVRQGDLRIRDNEGVIETAKRAK